MKINNEQNREEVEIFWNDQNRALYKFLWENSMKITLGMKTVKYKYSNIFVAEGLLDIYLYFFVSFLSYLL